MEQPVLVLWLILVRMVLLLNAGCWNQLLSQVLPSVGNFLVRIEKASMYSLRHLSFGFVNSSSLLSPIRVTLALESWVTPNLMSSRSAQ